MADAVFNESQALERLASIIDPIKEQDIISAGRLADIAFKDGVARAVLKIDPKDAELFAPIRQACEAALEKLKGVDKAQVILTAHEAAPTLKNPGPKTTGRPNTVRPHKASRPEGYQGDSQVKYVIATSSAKGGVGKSTIAVNLAVALAKRGKTVGVLDADIHGPSLPILLGLSGKRARSTETKWRPMIAPFEAHNVRAMSIGFLTKDDGPVVWRGPLVQGAISRMLWDVDWGALDYLFIDMPPGTGDPQLGLAQDIKPAGAIIISTPQDLALADARKGVQMFKMVDIKVLGVVENMGVFTCHNCGHDHHIFGQDGARQEAKNMGVSFLGSTPLDIALRESSDEGVPIAAGDGPIANIFQDIASAFEQSLQKLIDA